MSVGQCLISNLSFNFYHHNIAQLHQSFTRTFYRKGVLYCRLIEQRRAGAAGERRGDGARTAEAPVAGQGGRETIQNEEAAGPQRHRPEEGGAEGARACVCCLQGADAGPQDLQAALREQTSQE